MAVAVRARLLCLQSNAVADAAMKVVFLQALASQWCIVSVVVQKQERDKAYASELGSHTFLFRFARPIISGYRCSRDNAMIPSTSNIPFRPFFSMAAMTAVATRSAFSGGVVKLAPSGRDCSSFATGLVTMLAKRIAAARGATAGLFSPYMNPGSQCLSVVTLKCS